MTYFGLTFILYHLLLSVKTRMGVLDKREEAQNDPTKFKISFFW